jgi:hypothetical protein
VLRLDYNIPTTCQLPGELRIYGVKARIDQSGAPVNETVDLLNRPLTPSEGWRGQITALQSLGAADNGDWSFAAMVTCGGAMTVNYTGVGPTLRVAVQAALAPVITQAPQNVSAVVGGSVAFNVTATGDNLGYEWQRSDDGGTSYRPASGSGASISVTATAADNGSLWRVVVSNASGQSVSTPARLEVVESTTAPSVVSDPANQSVLTGETASFTVVASGSPLPAVQWQSRAAEGADPEAGWVDIASAMSSTYTTPSTSLAQSGSQYRAVLRNAAGVIASKAASLTVTEQAVAPVIVTGPQSQTVQAGEFGLFSVTASGSSPLSYQWFKNGQAIVGANGTEVLVLADPADAGGIYQITVQVSNPAGTVTSPAATLSVNLGGDPGVTVPITAAAGGDIRGTDGAYFSIPPGALLTDANITVRSVVPAGLPADFVPLGNAVSVTPADTVFVVPAELSIPLPADLDLPEGKALALIDLAGASNVNVNVNANALSVRGGPQRSALNLRRLAASGVRALGRSRALGDGAGGSGYSCASPQSVLNGNLVLKAFTGGTKALGIVDQTACTLAAPAPPQYGIPSSTTDACANDADYGAPTGGGEETLFNRHVQCARVAQTALVDLKSADGSTSFNAGEVNFDARIAIHGKGTGGLQKYVSLKLGYSYLQKDPDIAAPNVKFKAVIVCSQGLSCNSNPSVKTISPGGSQQVKTLVRFSWDDIDTNAVGEGNLNNITLFFTVDGTTPATVQGGSTYAADLSFYPTKLRCDVGQAKSNSSGCVFNDAAAVFALLPSDDTPASRKHIQDAFAGVNPQLTDIPSGESLVVPGQFKLKVRTRAIADVVGFTSLDRSRNLTDINSNRGESDRCCKSLFGPPPSGTPSSCPSVTDPDDIQPACDCDEYPFASTRQGAALVLAPVEAHYTVRRIPSVDNRSAGGKLGAMYLRERVLDSKVQGGSPFWVATP